jgi:hypothetical protein
MGMPGRLLRAIRLSLPMLSWNAASRMTLLGQLCAHLWAPDFHVVARELTCLTTTVTFNTLVRDLVGGPEQATPAASSTGHVVIE